MLRSTHATAVASALTALLLAAPPAARAAEMLDQSVDLTSEEVHKLVGLGPGDEFGWSLAVGDVDADGTPELAVGAPGASSHAGAVFVLSADELDAREHGAWDDRAIRVTCRVPGSRFGSALLFLDVDGDGRDELVVGAPEGAPDGELRSGRVFVFDLPPSSSELGPDDATVVVTGDASGDRFGARLERCDLDADGRDDLVVSAPGADSGGRVDAGAVYGISVPRLSSSGAFRASEVAEGRVTGADAGDALGTARALDADGDGAMELAVGAHGHDVYVGAGRDVSRLDDAGAVYILPASALVGSSADADVVEMSVARVSGRDERGMLGRDLAAGDIDGDGLDDLVISSHTSGRRGDDFTTTGSAYLVFGDGDIAAVLPGTLGCGDSPAGADDGPEAVTFLGRSMWDLFGLTPLVADVSGDGLDDILITAQFVNGFGGMRERSGEVYLYRGSLRSVMAAKGGTADRADLVLVGDAGDAVASALVSLDVTGDGSPELVIGAPEASGLDEEDVRRGRIYIAPAELLRAR